MVKKKSQHDKIQKLMKAQDAIQEKFGGRSPEYITMYYSYQLACLTKVLITLTGILAILTASNIWMIISR